MLFSMSTISTVSVAVLSVCLKPALRVTRTSLLVNSVTMRPNSNPTIAMRGSTRIPTIAYMTACTE